MRRIVVIATAFAVLVGAVSAYAATTGLNTYGAKIGFSPNKAKGALGFTEKYTASGNNGNRTAPLTDITTKIYGLTVDQASFPTCSLAKIAAAKSDAGCPKGAKIAAGSITAVLGPLSSTSASTPGTIPCDPVLDAWNGGPGKVVFFFVDKGSHACGPIQTGGVPPFQGSVKTVGKTLVMVTPIPSYVSFPIAGVEGSLTGETLHFLNQSSKGKAAISSVACNKGKRPYTVSFSAEAAPGQAPETSSVSGTQKCS